MRRLFPIVLLLFGLNAAAQQLDTVRMERLDSLLETYYVMLLPEDLPVKNGECDFLISSCKDSLVRQWVAIRIFEHYKESPMMGEEAVALHVYDKWFASGEVRMRNEMDQFQASMFADFNRSSMLYADAPVISMLSPEGRPVRIPSKDTLSVLYFYDTSCSKCKITSIVLPHVLEGLDFPVKLFALYTGSDPEQWAEFRKNFRCLSPNTEILHLWDPEVDSDYQKMYGVISTPKLFLVDGSGMIMGRRLEPESLKGLLGYYVTYYSSQDNQLKSSSR